MLLQSEQRRRESENQKYCSLCHMLLVLGFSLSVSSQCLQREIKCESEVEKRGLVLVVP